MSKTKRSRGRPEHKPTKASKEKVISYVVQGLAQPKIAKMMNMAVGTLRKHYKEELEDGKIDLENRCLKTLVDLALKKKDFKALVYVTKSQFGWTDRPGQLGDNAPPPRVVMEIIPKGKDYQDVPVNE